MEVAKAVTVLLFVAYFEGCGLAQEAVLKKEEFANNLSRCVALQPIDTCLGKILEDLRSLMPVGIPELGLRPTEPLKIENIQLKTSMMDSSYP